MTSDEQRDHEFRIGVLREWVAIEREKGKQMTRQHAGLHTREARSNTIKRKLNATAELIAGLRDDVRSIDANWTPEGRTRPRNATDEEWRMVLAYERGSRKEQAEAAFKNRAPVALRELHDARLGAIDAAKDDVQRERQNLDTRYDADRLSARRQEVRALITAPSMSVVGNDVGQRLASTYNDAVKFGDELGAHAIRSEAGELVNRAAANQDDESTDAVALRGLYHQFARDAEAERAAYDDARVEVAELEALGPKVAELVRAAQTDAGLTPAGMWGNVERGEWEQSILGLSRFEDGAVVMPAEPTATEPEAGVAPETDAARMERLA